MDLLGGMAHELHQCSDHARGVNGGLDLAVGSISEVRGGPASIHEDVVVCGLEQVVDVGESGTNLVILC